MRRFYDGSNWTDHTLPPPPPNTGKQRVAIGGLALAALLWIGAETHDTNCYTKATLNAISDAASGAAPEETDCLLLPWNEPE